MKIKDIITNIDNLIAQAKLASYTKLIKPFGDSSHIILPKRFRGINAKVVILHESSK